MAEPLRILHYLPSLDPTRGGPIRAVLDLSAAMIARGHYVRICTSELPARPDASSPVAQTLLTPPLGGLARLAPAALAQARGMLEASDLLHVHGVWDTSNVQLAALARSMSKPYFVSVRGMLDDWSMAQKPLKKRLFHTLVGKRHLERAAAVHLTADGEFEQARKWFPRGKGVVISNLLDLAPFRAAPGPEAARGAFEPLRRGEPAVLFLSRVHVKKGAEVLLEAAKLLHARGVKTQFLFAGAGDDSYLASLRASARTLGIDDRVHFLGHVGGTLKVSLYQACLCLALPTHQENFGFVFPEAMAAGTPVVTTKGVDIWPQLQRGGASIVDRTPSAFAEAIARLANDPSQTEMLGRTGREFVLREYDEGEIVSQFERMYRAR